MRVAICACALAGLTMLAGCSVQRTLFQEVYTDGTTATYKSTLLIPPGGKLDESAAAMVYQFDKDGKGRLSIGQEATGVDNTSQADMLRATAEILQDARNDALKNAFNPVVP